jgi:hypothetical protein
MSMGDQQILLKVMVKVNFFEDFEKSVNAKLILIKICILIRHLYRFLLLYDMNGHNVMIN